MERLIPVSRLVIAPRTVDYAQTSSPLQKRALEKDSTSTDDFLLRPGGTLDISRWRNHREGMILDSRAPDGAQDQTWRTYAINPSQLALSFNLQY
jgi:hypothetical protein